MSKNENGYKETEIGVIPEEWEVLSIPDLLTDEKGAIKMGPFGSQIKKEDLTTEGVHLIGIENVLQKDFVKTGDRYISYEKFESLKTNQVIPEDIVITTMGTVGYTGLIPNDIPPTIIDSHLIRLRVNEKVLNYFLARVIQDYELVQKQIKRMSQGGIMAGLNTGIIKQLKIPVPSKKEQIKISRIFESLDKVIEKTKAVIKQTEEVKKGLVQQLLTKGMGHTKFKKTEIGEIPLGWEVKELVELANSNDRYAFTGGPFGSNLKSSDYTENGVRIIQLQNIKDGYFANKYKIYTSESKANELFSCNIYPGDIIIAKMAEPVARACIIPNYSDRYLMASDGIRLSVDKTKYITEYVTYAINAPYFRKQAVNNSTGTTRLRIGLSTLRSLKILVPSIEEQKKIADILITVDRKLEREQSKVLKLKELKKGLMQSLLTGKVRVKVHEAGVAQV